MVRNHSPGFLVKTLQEQGLSLESKESRQLGRLMGRAEPGGGACPPRGSRGVGEEGRGAGEGARLWVPPEVPAVSPDYHKQHTVGISFSLAPGACFILNEV